jgi:ABC-type multidrug transport system fused ATPase/permease subunit
MKIIHFIQDKFNYFNFFLDISLKKNFFLIVFFTFISSFLEIIGIASIPILISQIFSKNSDLLFIAGMQNFTNREILLSLSFVIFFIFFIKNGFLAYVYFVDLKFCKKLNIFLKNRLFNKYLLLPYKTFVESSASVFARNVLDDTQNTTLYFYSLIVLIRETIVILCIFFFVFASNPKTSIIIIMFFLIVILIYYFLINKKIFYFGVKDLSLRKKQISELIKSFDSIDIIKIFNKESFFIKNFQKLNVEKEKNQLYMNYLAKLPRLFLEIISVFILIFLIYYFTYKNENIDGFLSYIVLLAIAVVRFIPGFNAITGALVDMKRTEVSVERIKNILKEKHSQLQEESRTTKENFKIINNINISNLDLIYGSSLNRVLKNVSLSINENDSVAIVGESGSGKSTLVKAILGLIEHQGGLIEVNNQNIYSDLDGWHASIGYIPQKIYLNDESIRKNIAFASEENDINNDSVLRAVSLANLDSFIKSLEFGLETNVGNLGSKISGGQLQRIGIARALYKLPQVLIMDEPTNSLDNYTSEKIIESINNMKSIKIKIIISHNKETVKSCNKVFFIKDGQITTIK